MRLRVHEVVVWCVGNSYVGTTHMPGYGRIDIDREQPVIS